MIIKEKYSKDEFKEEDFTDNLKLLGYCFKQMFNR